MFVFCSIIITIYSGDLPLVIKENVRGKVLFESKQKYVVDFSGGLDEFDLIGKESDYNHVIVDKMECVND